MDQPFVILTAARLLDGLGGPPLEDAAVLVEGDTIRAIGPVTLTNCTFDESEADGSGGAIYTESELTLTDCEFTLPNPL